MAIEWSAADLKAERDDKWVVPKEIADQSELIEKLRAELAAERESAEQYKQSLTDLHKLHCDVVAQNTKLREALEPFKEAAANFDGMAITNEEEWFAYSGQSSFEGQKGAITVGDLRRARAVLRETEHE